MRFVPWFVLLLMWRGESVSESVEEKVKVWADRWMALVCLIVPTKGRRACVSFYFKSQFH